MTKLTRLELDDGTTIYVEANDIDGSEALDAPLPPTGGSGTTRQAKGVSSAVAHQLQTLEGTIRTYTSHTLEAFRNVASANVDKVTLEFGVQVAGEAGVPYVTKGTAAANVKVTVECSFPD